MSERAAVKTARELTELPDDWFVFHDLALGADGEHLDHLVVGPGGVITLKTKSVTGAVHVGAHTIHVAGQSTQLVRKARIEAGLVARQLQQAVRNPVRVDAGIVFVNGCEPSTSVIGDVTVLSLDVLVAWLTALRSALSPKGIAAITRAVALPTTFVAEPASATTPARPEPAGDLVGLVTALKAWRQQRATGDRVPAHVVLSDSHLAGIATAAPKTLEDLARCIEAPKVEQYGDEILAVVTDAAR